MLDYFKEISQIPRCSGDESAVCDYLMGFARERGLEAVRDAAGNAIIRKSATKGYEDCPAVILQSHVDMVCVKTEDSAHDFTTDPIKLVVDGDRMRADRTTLGADNGIGVAMTMAVLASEDAEHPELEALFTVDEESGMHGAENLDGRQLKGKVLINIDSEEEGVVLTSCAGGVRALVKLPVAWEDVPKGREVFRVAIKGLKGGHSGSEIDKNRSNAIKMMGRIMNVLERDLGSYWSVISVDGGEKMNAIAKTCEAVIAVDCGKEVELYRALESVDAVFAEELRLKEEGYRLEYGRVDVSQRFTRVMDEDTKLAMTRIMNLIPNGIQTMSQGIKGLVESSNNVGELRTSGEFIEFNSAVRSSVRSLKDEITDRMRIICDLTGASLELTGDYPQWEYRAESRIRDIMADAWSSMYGSDLKVDAIHAGLECGFLKERIGDIDMVSIGPDVRDGHTPEESLSVSSTERVYAFLLETLRRMRSY